MTNLSLPEGYNNIELFEQRLKKESEETWRYRGEKRVLSLFHEMAERVPAYKDFLQSHSISPKQVATIEDFKKVPLIDKNNYLRKYPKEMLCWDGVFGKGQWVISTTSGSTGEPYYFPRTIVQDAQYAITAELYLRSNFLVHTRRTLYIVAFPMGAWIGGLFTYEALSMVARNGGYDLSIITPGIHKQEVINAVKQLAGNFDQIIIGAYAPFLKDILDDGERQGVKWRELNIGFVFSAEAFSEKFRDYVFRHTGSTNILTDSLNHYGTVDLGTMAHETPESILIRRTLAERNELALIFPESNRQPTFAQYNPELFYFETQDNNLICSAYSGLPLVRYDLRDHGGILPRSEVHATLQAQGIDIYAAAEEYGITDTLWNLPFVYVYERADFTVSYYAFLIYPDTIRRGLQQDELHAHITGKFSMEVEYDDTGRQKLHIHIEVKHGVHKTETLAVQVQQMLHDELLKESSEYRETSAMVGEAVKPVIHLWTYEDPTHFRAGTKQKWVAK